LITRALRPGRRADVEPSERFKAFVKDINSRPDAVPDALVEMYKEAVRRHGHW
jgi:hypothetical protein